MDTDSIARPQQGAMVFADPAPLSAERRRSGRGPRLQRYVPGRPRRPRDRRDDRARRRPRPSPGVLSAPAAPNRRRRRAVASIQRRRRTSMTPEQYAARITEATTWLDAQWRTVGRPSDGASPPPLPAPPERLPPVLRPRPRRNGLPRRAPRPTVLRSGMRVACSPMTGGGATSGGDGGGGDGGDGDAEPPHPDDSRDRRCQYRRLRLRRTWGVWRLTLGRGARAWADYQRRASAEVLRRLGVPLGSRCSGGAA
jgi:hypothetical protein